MKKAPWFRTYTETLRDRKLECITRDTHIPRATVFGAWNLLLLLASDSPERGKLLLVSDRPLTFDDLRAEMGLDPKTVRTLIEQFLTMEMVSYDGELYWITNWDVRQFKSDGSNAARMAEYRARKKAQETTTGSGKVTEQENNSDITVTEQGHNCALPEAEAEAEAEEDKGTPVPSSFDNWLRAIADPHSLNESNGIAVLVRMGQHLYAHFPVDKTIYGRVGKLAKVSGSQSKLARILWDNASKPLAVPVDYLSAVVYARDEESGPEPEEQRYYHTERLGS